MECDRGQMTDKLPTRPTQGIREALNELLRRNKGTNDKVAGEMFIDRDLFVARLRRPVVVEGQWENLDRTVDLLELIEAHRRGDE
ncbi:MAG: hypothetical protein KBD86_08220 [Candidatus Promineofilum sp.]|nr:hypothetical protein [Promineifilum sp.]